MDCLGKRVVALFTAAAVGMSGCGLSKQQKMTLDDRDDASVYDSTSLALEEPAVESGDPFGVTGTAPPITIREDEPPEYLEYSLEQVVQVALQNSRVLRDLGGQVLRSPATAHTVHDPSIIETDARFGVEAALSQFDTNLTSTGYFQKNNRALNNIFLGGGTRLLQQDADVFQTALTKKTAIGSTVSLTSNTAYDSNNAPGNEFFSSWNQNIEAQVRQPLLQGAGVDYNRIYGPSGIPGLPAGVLLARINTDASLADFEVGVRNFVSDVENAYWDLYFAYRDLDAKIKARDAALETWRRVEALHALGRRGGEAQQEAQAREQHFHLQEEVQNALTGRQVEGTRTFSGSTGGTFRGTGGVHVCERRLRLMMGLPISDGRLIRPADEPKMARAVFEWDVILAEALSRRAELRKQKWVVKNKEMSLLASQNLLLPQMDAIGLYRMRGFGKDLFDNPGDRVTGIFSSAWANLASAKFQEWQLGFEFSMPLGFRKGHVTVRNAELQLARERALLNEQERQVVLDLSNAVAEMSRAHEVLETNYNRRLAAKQQLKAIQAIDDPTPQMLYIELDSQRRLADAEANYYRALVEYEIAIKNVHFEKGSILEYNGIYLSELPSPAKAYQDAFEKIKMRSRSSRWAQEGSSTRVVSEGLVPQAYAPSSAPAAAPALPPAASPSSDGSVDPLQPVPQSRREAPLPSRAGDDADSDS
jgi:outer membrane protein TolC